MKRTVAKFVILLGGDVTVTPRLLRQIAGATVIAADGGMKHAEALNLMPALWIGDFDSSDQALQKQYAQIPRLAYPAEKDQTDGAIAIAEALNRGATELVLVGGFGGQTDHVLAHVMLLHGVALRGVKCFLTSGTEEAYAIQQALDVPDLTIGTRISIIGFSELVGLTLTGVKWPLSGRSVALGDTLTLSNVATGPVKIALASGLAMAIIYPDGA
jgi:thiamine pyrophosphokinase